MFALESKILNKINVGIGALGAVVGEGAMAG